MPTLFDLLGINSPQPVKPEPLPESSGMLRRTLGDTGVSLVKSAVGLPETFVGMADLVTGGRAGKLVEDAGIRFKDTNRALDELYSPEYQAASKKVQSAEGIFDTLKAAFENPSTIYHGAVTSMGSMLAGSPVGRAATALRAPGWLAGGIGEGAAAAGQNLEQVRQESPDGLVTGEQSGIIGASGAITAAISSVAGRLANRLGIGDVDQLIAGAQRAGPAVQKGLARKLVEGFATEGLLQEFPQSFQEQVAQNIAQGKPWNEGAANAAVMGGLSGGLLGAGAAPFGGAPEAKPALLPETGPMSRAVNAATVAARGTPLDFTPTEIPGKGDGLAVQPPPDTTALDFEADPRYASSIAFPNGKAPEQQLFPTKQLADIHIGEQGAFGELQAVEAGGGKWTVVQTPEAANRNARANIEMWMERAQPMEEADAKDMAKRAESELNKPMTALPMPDGQGWTVVPRQWVTAPVLLEYTERAAAAKQALEAPVDRAPRTGSTDGVEIDPAGPNMVARYIAEQAATNTPAARAFVQDYRAGRITDADVLALIAPQPAAEPTPDERLAAAAEAGKVESDSTPASLILNREGKPFKTEFAAAREQKKHPGSQVVRVEGGHAVQPAPVESSNADVAQAPAAAEAEAATSTVEEGADRAGPATAAAGEPGVRPGVEAGSGGAVEAPRVSATTAPAIAKRSRLKNDRAQGWTAFPADSGTKGIPRADMPQIAAEHRGAMVNFLNARGIAHQQEEVPAADLKPTQAEYSTAKVKKAKAYKGGDRSILVSSDGHVLDGHHQWLAKKEAGEPVNVIRLDAPIDKLLTEVRDFPSATTSEGAQTATEAAKPEAQPASEPTAVEPASVEPTAEPGMASATDGEKAPQAETPPAEAASEEAPAKPAKADASGTISDIGEKIGGARKDMSVSGGRGRRRTTDDTRPAWARRFQISQIVTPPGMIGEAKNAGRWVIRDSKLLDWTKQPRQVGNETYATKEEAEAVVPIAAVSLKHRALSTRDGKYEIWRDISDRKRVKVVDKEFATRDEALAYMAANAADIIETNTTFGEADMPLPPDRARSGPARREGNVKGEDFKETFGLRAVEFGNWNNQDDRQSLMNDAWDGLMDLADVLGIPPKAIGLNGDLALAFGARGHGLQGARAHYELDRAVINLTKEKGAGSLAHEWFHAADHYFGRQDGKASATWQIGPDGTRTLKIATPGADMASGGFQRSGSGVRPEVRAAYETLLRTIFKKAEGYVEDTAKVDKFTGQAREELARRLNALRADLSEQKDKAYWKRNNSPATAEQLGEFDAIAAKMLAGESLSTDWRWVEKNAAKAAKGRATANRWTNDALERLSAIYKAVRGRTGFTTSKDGTLDDLRGYMERYGQRLKMLAEAQSGTEKTRQVPTEFAMNAKELDQGRGTDYWTTPHEMAARAFQGYVEDKVAERGGVSRFLNYGPENAGILTPWGFKRPFPAGVERVAINKAFDAFIGELKTKETDSGVALFSRSAEPLRKLADLAKTATNANETVAVGPVSAEQAALLAAEGVAVSETTKHTADLYAVRHALNRHGDEATEKARGQLPISADDIARVAEVVGEPDAYAVGPKTKRGDDLVGYIKRMPDGAILYIEELRTGKNRLAMLSMRKYPGAKDFALIAQSLLSNARSDTGDVRIVYPQQGDVQAFSRGGVAGSPWVTVDYDESGFPLFIGDKVRLEFPQVTARLDVIEQDGEQVINYPIMAPAGFEVLGHVELLVKDGRAVALLDIEVNKDARKRGVARSAVEAILAGTDGKLNISNIVTEARGFWSKLGVPEQNLPDGHAYEGTINANSFRQGLGADASGVRAGAVEAESRARGAGAQEDGRPDAGAESPVDGAPGSPRGETEARPERRKAVEALVARVTARWKNAPEVVVVASMTDPLVPRAVRQANSAQLSQGAQGNPEGFFHDGKVYLVAPQLGGDADVVRVLFHEALGHYGLRGTFGPELGTILDRLAVLNAGKVRAKAKQYGLDYDKPSDRRMAAEEVLAEMAQKASNIGWAKKAVAAIRTWLREHVPGFRKMAMSDDEIVRSFILPARAFVQRSDGASADGAGQPAFSRSALADAVANLNQEGVRNAFLDAVTTHGKTNLWGRTVGTQYHKAQTHPKTFGRVFNAVQDYIAATSVFANRAADLAPSLLPKLDTMADLTKDGLWRHGADPKDTAKAGEAIFQGTLNKELYDDATLRSRFGLTPKQVEIYREFRAAVDQSLEGLGKTEILRIAGEAGRSVRAEVLAAPSLDDAAEILTAAVAGDQDAVQQIQEKVARVTQLQDEGYAPLMRFGKHTLHVTGPGGSTEFFGMYETVRDANRAARQLRADPEMAKFTFTQGVMSEEGHKLFNGLSMDSLELFADTTGRSDDPVFQAYLKLAIANRSALKRMIERQGIKGYSDDVARVLASFVTSNARMSAGHLHLADAKKAAEAIPKEQGDLRDDAIKLVEYVTTPTEEAAAVRGLLFTSFIGGSVASALVNMTQPITMTLPYLTQYGGASKAGKRLTAAMAMVASGKGMDPELAAALKRAEDDGIVSPQEIHHLQAQAMNTLGKNPLLKKAAFVWGALFSLAEQFNRRVSFVAAYETAKAQGIPDPFGFAEKAVIETQGLYNKGNKANLARGAVGATVMTFKQFSTHYLEFLVRMWKSGPEGKKAVAVALALLILMGGAGGLPFADDLDDLIDTLGQAMGYDMNSKRWKRQFVAQTLGLGDAAADVATRGLTALPGFPLDLSLRMGMGNLLPATGLFLRSNTDTARQLLEVAGAAGGLAANVKDGVNKVLAGDVFGGIGAALPIALQNAAKGYQMAWTGEYRNTKGAKVMDVDALDAALKGIGFQPAQVARESGRVGEAMRSIQLAKNVESEIAGRWAQAMVDKDAEGVDAAKQQLADWNAANPTAPIKITIPQVLARAKALRQSRADRTVKAAPKEMRSTVKEALS